MLAMAEKTTDYTHDITYYAKNSRLTEPSDGKRYERIYVWKFTSYIVCTFVMSILEN